MTDLPEKIHNGCGGTIGRSSGGNNPGGYSYCQKCGAYKYDSSLLKLFPGGKDGGLNNRAWHLGELISPGEGSDQFRKILQAEALIPDILSREPTSLQDARCIFELEHNILNYFKAWKEQYGKDEYSLKLPLPDDRDDSLTRYYEEDGRYDGDEEEDN